MVRSALFGLFVIRCILVASHLGRMQTLEFVGDLNGDTSNADDFRGYQDEENSLESKRPLIANKKPVDEDGVISLNQKVEEREESDEMGDEEKHFSDSSVVKLQQIADSAAIVTEGPCCGKCPYYSLL